MISSNTYEEIYVILGYMDKLTVMKIPEQILIDIKNKRNKNYKTNVNKNDIFNEKNVSKEAIDFLCWLDYNYWMDENKKRDVDNISKEKYLNSERKKIEKYNTENIFKNRQTYNNIQHIEKKEERLELVEYNNKKWYKKAFEKILKFFIK